MSDSIIVEMIPVVLHERIVAELQAENAALKEQLTAMTIDRNLWQDAHNEDCPNAPSLEATSIQLDVPEGMLSLPYLQEVVGMVSGVGFDPGKSEVRLKTDETANVTMMATEQQVNNALVLRHEKIRALLLHSEVIGNKLLTLVSEDSPRPSYSDEEYIFEKWGRTLQELARDEFLEQASPAQPKEGL